MLYLVEEHLDAKPRDAISHTLKESDDQALRDSPVLNAGELHS
jgi:hypothetical protein